jgi:hypothetical protein
MLEGWSSTGAELPQPVSTKAATLEHAAARSAERVGSVFMQGKVFNIHAQTLSSPRRGLPRAGAQVLDSVDFQMWRRPRRLQTNSMIADRRRLFSILYLSAYGSVSVACAGRSAAADGAAGEASAQAGKGGGPGQAEGAAGSAAGGTAGREGSNAGGPPLNDGGGAGTSGGANANGSGGGVGGTTGAAGAGGATTTGQDYYCDPANGLPTNPGSSASPWRRLEEVFSSAKTFADGDVIHLRTGNHGGPVVAGGIVSGNRTISAEPGQSPVIRTIRFAAGATHWTVDGVLVSPQEADGKLTSDSLVQFDANATNDVLQNSQLRYAPDSVASTWNNAAWLENSGIAVYVIGANNQIINNQIRNTHDGVMLERTSTAGAGATGSLVRGNSVNHFWEDAYRGKVSDCTFEYNSAVNSYAVVPPGTEGDPPHRDMFQSYRGDGSFTSVDNVVLRGNVFIARQGTRYTAVPFQYHGFSTIQGISAFDGPYSNWTIENNVVMVEVGLAVGLFGMDNSKIVNNTVVPDPFGTDSEIRIVNEKGDVSTSDNDIIRNNLAHTLNIGAATHAQVSNNLTADAATYSTFFVSYAAGDLHLKAGSPAIDAGTALDAPTTDADEDVRTAPYDVGAYEFGATAH